MSRRVDAATLLERALAQDGGRAQVTFEVNAMSSTRWASATFMGARHRMTIDGPSSPAIGPWLSQLPEADLPLRGHLVADLAVVEHAHADGRFRATIEVLTVEEG